MYQGDNVILTGSYVRGTQTDISDIDFIVIRSICKSLCISILSAER